jgi:hypothetical protein
MIVSDRILGDHSKYFDLDAWAERNLPFLVVPKASQKEKNIGMVESKKDKNVHPTVKPIKLMTYLITMGSREGDVVLDPFCGSGTTCMAAKMLKRNYIGIELDPGYREIALNRVDSVEPINSDRKSNVDIRGLFIENLKLIVGQQLRENPIGVKIALKYYVNKVDEIKRSHNGVDLFEDKKNSLQDGLSDFFRNEARRFVESNKNGSKGSKTRIEIKIKNTPEVAGLCLVIKSMIHGSSGKSGKAGSLNVGDSSDHESEIEDLMPYLPMLLKFA